MIRIINSHEKRIYELELENKQLLEALQEIMDCPYDIDQATVPKAGIDAAPEQVVGMMSMALWKYRKARKALAAAGGNDD
jgi:hypothetical protein